MQPECARGQYHRGYSAKCKRGEQHFTPFSRAASSAGAIGTRRGIERLAKLQILDGRRMFNASRHGRGFACGSRALSMAIESI
jgi:hypothetical protein